MRGWPTIDRAGTAVLLTAAIALAAVDDTSATQLEPDQPIDLELERAPLVETLQSFASISGSQLDIPPGLEGWVTLTLEKTPWHQVLEQICTTHHLRCELLDGEPSVLQVRRISTTQGAASSTDPPELISRSESNGVQRDPTTNSPELPAAVAQDRWLKVRWFSPEAPEPIEGVARFSWATPMRTLDLALRPTPSATITPPSEDRQRELLRLSWIPFGPDLDLVAPMILRCDPSGVMSELLPLARWPDEASIRRTWRDARLELTAAPSNPTAARHLAAGIDCPTRGLDAEAQDSAAGRIRAVLHRADGKDRNAPAVLELASRPGTYLLVNAPGHDVPKRPAAAILALGSDAGGAPRVALLRPTPNGIDSRSEIDFRVEQRTLSADEIVVEKISADHLEFELQLRAIRHATVEAP